MTRRGLISVAAVVLAICGCAQPALTAAATNPPPSSSVFTAGFSPNRLGAYSTMELWFHLYRPDGAVPPPLVGVEFLLPPGVSLTTSSLGLDTCDETTVANVGAGGCLPDAVMGYGSAQMIAPTEAEGIVEPASVTILQAPPVDRHTTMLFDVSGVSPVIAQVAVVGQMLDAPAPFEGNLSTSFPITPGLPGEKDVSVVSMRAGIGSKGVTYYRYLHGVRVPYTPHGIVVPSHCPTGGFRFGATFHFMDGTSESASATSPCPIGGRRGRGHR